VVQKGESSREQKEEKKMRHGVGVLRENKKSWKYLR
jgi:hypothetical protein